MWWQDALSCGRIVASEAGGFRSGEGPAIRRRSMDMQTSLALAVGFLALAAFAGWRGARPPNPHKGPRLAPWRFIMLLAAACLVFLLGHVVQMLGATGVAG